MQSAISLVQAHRNADAVKALHRARQQAGNCVQCWQELSAAFAHTGERQDALKAADRAIALAPDAAAQSTGHKLKGTALAIFALNNDDKELRAAEAEFRSALQAAPNDGELHFQLAATLFRRKQQADGLAELQRYLELDPHGRYAVEAAHMAQHPEKAMLTYVP